MLLSMVMMLTGLQSEPVDFARDIQPILAANCYQCHGPDPSSRKAGLRLDIRDSAIREAIVPGDADRSVLIRRLTAHDDDRMPPPDREPLGPEDVELLRRWIDEGAEWSSHWCWTALERPEPPAVRAASWGRDELDAFVLAPLESAGLQPAREADRSTLLRRLSFDLTGLPPTIEELDAFELDDRPDAYERVVDRMLASPRFGEHWGRHWLDIVRYAETCGHEFDYPIPHAWRYRDWVIRAFNADVPYDRFVLEQLAGDLVESPRRHPADDYDESIIGTGFWFFSQATHAPVDVRQNEAERIENQIDVFGKAFLGLTIACARCHDHKFDPIPTTDYYALAGFLQSSRRQNAYLDPGGHIAEAIERRRRWNDSVLAEVDDRTPPAPNTNSPSVDAFETFDDDGWNDWFPSGHAFGDGPLPVGRWYVADRSAQRADVDMASSDGIARELQGTLRSPTFLIEHDRIHIRARGRGSRMRLIIDGFVLNEYNALLFEGFIIDPDTPTWQSFSMDTSRYRGHRAHLAFIDDGHGWIDIDEIRFDDQVDAHWPEPVTGSAQPAAEGAPSIPEPMRVLAITDGTPEDEYVFIRGRHDQPGSVVERRFLEAIAGPDQPTIRSGSGRLELARRLLDPANPLPARVMANRAWQHLFGRGLSETPDDFGLLGRAPSHPELLDLLAADLQEHWSLKRLIRRIVCSSAYRMGSVHQDPAATEIDPDNRMLHRMHRSRLQGEAIRDAMLRVSGELDVTMHGPSVPVHLTDFMTGRGRPGQTGPLDGAGRRSVYQEIRRNFLPPMMLAFDMPIPSTCQGRRHDSNVPAQSLTLMNDPFVKQQADRWAERVLAMPDATDADRIRAMYRSAFGRIPSDRERDLAIAFIREHPKTGWHDFAHVLFNSKEFVFVD